MNKFVRQSDVDAAYQRGLFDGALMLLVCVALGFGVIAVIVCR